MIHSSGHLAGDVLLGILGPDRGEEPLQRGDEAGRRGDGDPIIEGHQVRGQRSPSRITRAAQAACVDLRSAGQVIQGPNSIPDPVRSSLAANQECPDPRHRMLSCRSLTDDRLAVGIQLLNPLSLPDRIITESRHAVLSQEYADTLIRVGRLAIGGVSARNEHAGERRLSLGQVEQCGDMMTRPAVEDDPLEFVSRILSRTDDLRVERGSLRKIAQGLKEEGPELLLPLCDLLGGRRRGHLAAATGEKLGDLVLEKPFEHTR